MKARPVSGLAGVRAKPGRKPVSLDEMDRAIAEGAAKGAKRAVTAAGRYGS